MTFTRSSDMDYDICRFIGFSGVAQPNEPKSHRGRCGFKLGAGWAANVARMDLHARMDKRHAHVLARRKRLARHSSDAETIAAASVVMSTGEP